MSKTPYNEKLDYILKTFIQPHLGKKNYKRKDRNFFQENPETWVTINFQGNKWNTAEEGSFTVNLGLFFKKLDTSELLKCPPAYLMHLQSRIGHFIEKSDTWFEVNNSTNLLILSRDLINIFNKDVLPVLSAINSEKGFIDYLDNDISLMDKFWLQWVDALKVLKENKRNDLALKIIDSKLSKNLSEKQNTYMLKLREEYS